MPETAIRPTSSTETNIDNVPALNSIGVEFEYPVGATPASDGPDLHGSRSNALRGRHFDPGVSGLPSDQRIGRDHTGAEVRSPVMDLHTSQPEEWHASVIRFAEQEGYNFAANGFGETVFGLHLHLSRMSQEQIDAIQEMVEEGHWMRVFVCASIAEDSTDPWRHGGVSSSSFNPRNTNTTYRRARDGERHGDRHYEWRLPEPVMPEHFGMIMHFLRLISFDEIEEARDYARGAVESADSRLTAVQQYERMKDERDGWPGPSCIEDDRRTTTEAAEYMVEIMGDTID